MKFTAKYSTIVSISERTIYTETLSEILNYACTNIGGLFILLVDI